MITAGKTAGGDIVSRVKLRVPPQPLPAPIDYSRQNGGRRHRYSSQIEGAAAAFAGSD